MLAMTIYPHEEMSLRDKARLNVDIARDLADSFGGDIADYLKKLNGKLKKLQCPMSTELERGEK